MVEIIILIIILLVVIYYFYFSTNKVEKFRNTSHSNMTNTNRINTTNTNRINTNRINSNMNLAINNKSTANNKNNINMNPNNVNNFNRSYGNFIGNTTSFQNAAYTLDTTAPDMHVTNNKVDNSADYPIIVKNNIPDYNKLLGDDNKNVKYYYNDVINQSKINENAYDVINQIDVIDYSDVKTGLQKCQENCDGVCFELGYMGTATCFPKQVRSFDYGSIYKNPTFIYG